MSLSQHLSDAYYLKKIGHLSILFVLVGIYFSLLVEAYFGFTQLRNIFYVFGVLLFIVYAILKGKLSMHGDFFEYSLLAIPIALVSIFFWESLRQVNVYVVLITTVLVVTTDLDFFKKAVKYLFYFSILLALYEYIAKDYVLVVIRNTPWGPKPLDEHFFGGYSGIFRAKALFEGPLALAQLSIGMALLFKNDVKIIILSVFASFLANGRLAILLTALILLIYIFKKYDLAKILLNKNIDAHI